MSLTRLAASMARMSWSSACRSRSTAPKDPRRHAPATGRPPLAPLSGLHVSWQDERHTSQDAEARIGGPARGRAGGAPSAAAMRAYRARVDREAATAIVQAALDARRVGAHWQRGGPVTWTGRGDPTLTEPVTSAHVQRQGSVSSRELLGLKRARPRGPWRGLVFLALLMAVIVVGGVVVVGPRLRDAAYDISKSNPQLMRLPFVPEIVKERLGANLDTPFSNRATPVKFTIEGGETVGPGRSRPGGTAPAARSARLHLSRRHPGRG